MNKSIRSRALTSAAGLLLAGTLTANAEDIVIWGGGIDTQKILPQGTVKEVKDEILRMLDIFMPVGGFVFAPVHAIQYDVPTENILAMWETIREFGKY